MYAQVSSVPFRSFDPAALSVCRGLGRQAGTHVAAIGSVHRVRAGQTVFAEAEPAENVYEIVSGKVRLCKLLPDGRRQITGFIAAGNILGLALEGQYLYSAEAITDVTLCRYPRARFDRLVDEVPGFARRLLSMTSDELRSAQDQMLLLGRKSASEKIASFLLAMSPHTDSDDEAEEVHLPMARGDIADYLGLTMETVSRTLTILKHQGLIAIPTPARIQLIDRDRLEEIAAGECGENL